jgi:hypothetical protein
MRIFPFDIGDQFDPVDGATLRRFFWSDDRNIIFRLASDHAGLTRGAFIQVNHHSPSAHLKLHNFRFKNPEPLTFTLSLRGRGEGEGARLYKL